MLLMPLIEWVCIAAIPTLLCIHNIVQFSLWPFQFDEHHKFNTENVEVLSMMTVIISTSILTLLAIVLFGDDTIESGNTDVGVITNSRGAGLVVGSHLMPLLYMSIQIFMYNNQCNNSIDQGLVHLKLAIFGGLAFSISGVYVRWQHRKLHSGRLKSNGYEHSKEGKERKKLSQQGKLTFIMQLTSSVYIILLMGELVTTRMKRSQQQNFISTFTMGIFHACLIASYPGPTHVIGKQQYSWQNAFTPGEWMAVSTFISTVVVAFFEGYVFLAHDFSNWPEHIKVSHAGLSGCILGIAGVLCLRRITEERSLSTLSLLVMVVATTVGCLEVALDATQTNYTTLASYLGLTSKEFRIPQSIEWILNFLFMEQNSDRISIRNVPSRIVILSYWMLVLALTLPVSMSIARWTLVTTNQRRRVVMARKYFHLVAILLFAPITWLDRDMMCLSYAIAVALLLLMEMIRVSQKSTPNSTTNNNSNGSSEISALNQFYSVFFDEKDSSGGIVVSHIALVVGCACPLWIHQLIQCKLQSDVNSTDEQLLDLLPYVGVVVLGIGDSAGAIGGLSFRFPTNWPGGSSRTLEGSLCMLLSMVCAFGAFALVCGLEVWQCIDRSFVPLLVLTLIEASTKQIDNMCLPIAACTLFLLQQ